MSFNAHKNHFYITTPIYYATAKPHLGSLYSTVLADVIARWHRIQGQQVFFLTGTDEHGQKIANAAAKAGKEPKEFVDSFIPVYKDVWAQYQLEYTRFMRTTDSDHGIHVQQLIEKLLDQGDIYKGAYTGWYCIPCETFLTEKESITSDNKAPACPSCSRITEWIEETTYFFKLSKYSQQLLAFYKEHPDFIVPKERAQEVIKFVEAGLKDISISRSGVKWGVPFPGDKDHILYVWIEALCNYITAIGYGDKTKEQEFMSWWPADVQIIGKDIIRFHAVFWPALLMAAGLPLPRRLLVHGWIKINDQKMSKSLGNVIDPVPLRHLYGADCIRYFMVRYLPINQDGDFSIEHLEQSIESDLANDLGNLLNRMVLLAQKYNHMTITPVAVWSQKSLDLRDAAYNMIDAFESYLVDYQLHLAYARLWQFIKQVNAYFHETEPWKIAESDVTYFNEILSATAHSLYIIGTLCWPVMPSKMEQLFASLGLKLDLGHNMLEKISQAVWHQRFALSTQGPLFEKPQEKTESTSTMTTQIIDTKNYIDIDDLSKVELVVGTIIECEPMPKSDRLLKLKVDLGSYGIRTILSGIQKWYKPIDLMGKQAIFITNLKPRAMMGIESHGMMLCAEDDQKRPVPATVSFMVPNGTRLK